MSAVARPAPPRPAPTVEDGGGAPAGPQAAPAAHRRRRYVARRVAVYLFTAWAVVTVVFALPRAMPGDPLAAKSDDAGGGLTDLRREALAEQYHLDEPLLVQYREYLSSLARGDLGTSIQSGGPVADLLRATVPWTLLLVGTALVLSSVVSFATGVTAAWRRGRRTDRELVVGMTALNAVPEYVVATLLFIALAVVVPVFPTGGGSTPFTGSEDALYKAGDVLRHLVLPATALSLGMLGMKFLLVRNTTVSVLGQDYMVLARAKGLPPRLVKYRHAGRNVLLPFVTVVGLQVAFAAGGALFVEAVFAYPGVASLMLPAVEQLDYPVLDACFVVLGLTVVTVNLVVDLAYARLDPRVAAQ